MRLDTNPYSSPQEHNGPWFASRRHGTSFVPIVAGIALVVGCAFLFAVIGGLVALALNQFAPAYYPGVFPHAVGGGYACIVGVGTGILQGLILGFLVGSVVAASLGWFKQLQLTPCARALTIIAAFGIGFAVVGTLVGYGLGTFAPDYYRGVVSGGRQPNFNPVDVGIGLGCSEGLLFGAVVGTVVVVVLAWRQSGRTSPRTP
jgi:hypothetical protein